MPEGGQPTNAHNRGASTGLRGFRGSSAGGCSFYPGVCSVIKMVSRGTHGQHHSCLLRVVAGLEGGSSLAQMSAISKVDGGP